MCDDGSNEHNMNTMRDEESSHISTSTSSSLFGVADLGMMADGLMETTTRQFQYIASDNKQIVAIVNAIDDYPGALQSGHYLWPGASALAKYLVKMNVKEKNHEVLNIIELGAGCGLVGIVAWQALIDPFINKHDLSLDSSLVFTDHDYGTLDLSRKNFQASLAYLEQKGLRQNLSQPNVWFEPLQWGNVEEARKLMNKCDKQNGFQLVLGSDLIYCVGLVRPLFITVGLLLQRDKLKKESSFILCQSFIYDFDIEQEIDAICAELKMHRQIRCDTLSKNDINLCDTSDFGIRIQEFVYL